MEHKKGWNPFMEENGIEIVSESAERTVLRVIPQKKHRNPYNMIHGGLLFTMIDCAAGITARADGNAYVTQNSYVNFLNNTDQEEEVLAETDVIRRGTTIVVVHVVVRTSDGKKLADAVVDMFRVNGMPDMRR
ncbi:MAG: PaaI family thioesterase [Lachnospiraceae bacterium]|nr:PaaI family thioesterase [Lachnospiraceae bacterium]